MPPKNACAVVVGMIFGLAIILSANTTVGQTRELVPATDVGVQSTIDALRAATRQLWDECEFHCSYTRKWWVLKSIRYAEDDIDSTEAEIVERGQFTKRRELKRISQYRVKPAIDEPIAKQEGTFEMRGIPEDALVGADAFLTHNASVKGIVDSVSLAKISGNAAMMRGGGCTNLEQQLSAMNGLPGCRRDIFCGERNDDMTAEYTISHPKPDTVVVTTVRHKPYQGVKGVLTCVTQISTRPATPVIEAIEIRQIKMDGKEETELSRERVKFSDFKNCGDYSIAACVRREMWFPNGTVSVTEWKSADLGERRPVNDDFVIRISDSTHMIGFRPGIIKPGILNLGPELLVDSAVLPANSNDGGGIIFNAKPQSQKVPEARGTGWSRLVVINVLMLGVALTVAFLRRRKG